MKHKQLKLTRRGLLKAAVRTGIGTVGLFAWSREIEPEWVEVNHIDLKLPRLAAPFHDFKLAQISDIHMDSWMTRSRLEEVVHLVNSQQPDMVAITGDFVTYISRGVAANLVRALSQLRPRLGTVAVLGNHDHWTNAIVIRRVVAQAGMIDLSNKVHTLHRGDAMLHLAGLDDAWAGQDDMDAVMQQLPSQGAAILLAHEPDFADEYVKTRRFDLQLSGHSHGGQVRVPLVGPIKLPPYGKQYHSGLYQVDDMQLYTNRGIGMLWPHVRFNCRPEITIFHLQSSAA
ncbi:MAG: metallophosphoesterase [Abitibacteriaceae bacterium]|nr:metallophosphoesterase [Abditibacteriaceae bacterium]